jgi:hypothetical protein
MSTMTAPAATSSELALLRQAFRRRAMEAVDRATLKAAPNELAEALSAPTGIGGTIRLLGDVAVQEAVAELEPLAAAFARGAAARQALVQQAGGLLSAGQMGVALGGISRQAVDKRRRAGQLLAMQIAGDWRYPAAQVDADGRVPAGLPTVLKALAESGPWGILAFLVTPQEVLEGTTPLQALREGGEAADYVFRMLHAMEHDAYL